MSCRYSPPRGFFYCFYLFVPLFHGPWLLAEESILSVKEFRAIQVHEVIRWERSERFILLDNLLPLPCWTTIAVYLNVKLVSGILFGFIAIENADQNVF